MSGFNVNLDQKFSQVFDQLSSEKGFSKDTATLRLKEEKTLYLKEGSTLESKATTARAQRETSKASALGFIATTIDNQLGVPGSGLKLLGHLGLAGTSGTHCITSRDLRDIQLALTRVRIPGLSHYQTMTDTLSRLGLGNLAHPAKDWLEKISPQGASGVIFVRHDGMGAPEVCLKFISKEGLMAHDLFHRMMRFSDGLFELPLLRSPAYLRLDLVPGSNERQLVAAKLDRMIETLDHRIAKHPSSETAVQSQSSKNKIKDDSSGKGFHYLLKNADGLAIFEKVPRCSTLSGTSPKQKMTLLDKSTLSDSTPRHKMEPADQKKLFGVQLGRMGVIGCMFGLNDHLPIGSEDVGMGVCNFGNLLVDEEGVVQLIDIDLARKSEGRQQGFGRVPEHANNCLRNDLDTLVAMFTSKNPGKSVKEAISRMLKPNVTATMSVQLWMKGMFSSGRDCFFENDADTLRNVTDHQKIFTGLCMLKGQLEGLHFLATHGDSIRDEMISTKQYVEGYPETLDTITKGFGQIAYGEALRVLNGLIDEMMK